MWEGVVVPVTKSLPGCINSSFFSFKGAFKLCFTNTMADLGTLLAMSVRYYGVALFIFSPRCKLFFLPCLWPSWSNEGDWLSFLFWQPLGYKIEDSKLKRAGLDYWPYPPLVDSYRFSPVCVMNNNYYVYIANWVWSTGANASKTPHTITKLWRHSIATTRACIYLLMCNLVCPSQGEGSRYVVVKVHKSWNDFFTYFQEQVGFLTFQWILACLRRFRISTLLFRNLLIHCHRVTRIWCRISVDQGKHILTEDSIYCLGWC